MKDKKVVVLLSGGQDSTTCLYWAIAQGASEIHALTFKYGQSHENETIYARRTISTVSAHFDMLPVFHNTIQVEGLLPHSSLTQKGDHNQMSHINHELPASFTAGRNLLFTTIAASYAADEGINDIVLGVCQTDYSGYPDCRRTTIDAMQTTLSLGMGAGDFRLHTPLMYLTKAETWKMAKDLNILDEIIHNTMTDYNGSKKINEWGYGELDNPASKLRAKGYFEAKEKGWI